MREEEENDIGSSTLDTVVGMINLSVAIGDYFFLHKETNRWKCGRKRTE
jgi:hypothetical protein